MAKWQVIVGNVGTVYDGDNGFEANKLYNHYVSLSKRNYGRAGQEAVHLFKDDELYREHYAHVEGEI